MFRLLTMVALMSCATNEQEQEQELIPDEELHRKTACDQSWAGTVTWPLEEPRCDAPCQGTAGPVDDSLSPEGPPTCFFQFKDVQAIDQADESTVPVPTHCRPYDFKPTENPLSDGTTGCCLVTGWQGPNDFMGMYTQVYFARCFPP